MSDELLTGMLTGSLTVLGLFFFYISLRHYFIKRREQPQESTLSKKFNAYKESKKPYYYDEDGHHIGRDPPTIKTGVAVPDLNTDTTATIKVFVQDQETEPETIEEPEQLIEPKTIKQEIEPLKEITKEPPKKKRGRPRRDEIELKEFCEHGFKPDDCYYCSEGANNE